MNQRKTSNKNFREYNYDCIATELINQAKSPYSVDKKSKSIPMDLMRPRRNSQLSDGYKDA